MTTFHLLPSSARRVSALERLARIDWGMPSAADSSTDRVLTLLVRPEAAMAASDNIQSLAMVFRVISSAQRRRRDIFR